MIKVRGKDSRVFLPWCQLPRDFVDREVMLAELQALQQEVPGRDDPCDLT